MKTSPTGRPYIFMEFDDTLVNVVPELIYQQLYYDKHVELSGTVGEYKIVARPGLEKFLKECSKIGQLHILSIDQKKEVEESLKSLGVRNYFDGVWSIHNIQDQPPQVIPNEKWVMIDDIFLLQKLWMLGAKEIDYSAPLDPKQSNKWDFNVIRVHPFDGNVEYDHELSRILPEIRIKL